MAIDETIYLNTINSLILDLNDENDFKKNNDEIIIQACKNLKISKFERVLVKETALKSLVGETTKDISYLYYDDGNKDESSCLSFQFETKFKASFTYYIYNSIGAPEWTKEDIEKLNTFAKMVFIINGRSSLMERIYYLNFYDKELGVYNMSYAKKYMADLIRNQEIQNYYVAFCNINRFSVVNQVNGRRFGDLLMKQYYSDFNEATSEDSIIFRIGGDRFGFIVNKNDIDFALKYVSGVEVEVKEYNEKMFVSARAGIYKCISDMKDFSQAFDCATVAYQIAKEVLNENYVFYREDIANKVTESKLYEIELHDALANEEFLVYYQPKAHLTDYRLTGAEALCRWKHEDELIPPFKFIPVFEQSNAICKLDFYMLEHVCMDLRRWIDEGKNVVKISVNFSRRHLSNMNLTDDILNIVDKYDIPHNLIEIELTETTTDVDFKDLKRVANRLLREGISIAVDDFGIGYSSLNLIKEIPWTVIKLDKSFLERKGEDNNTIQKMLKYVVALCRELGMECIVEGVETAEHVRLLKENNCFYAQGFYFDRPLPVEEYEKRLLECTM